jgi:tRNA-dihydrouridine synthase B
LETAILTAPKKQNILLHKTGVDALMIGRGAIGRPWLFNEVKHYLETGELLPSPNVAEVVEILKEQIRLNLEWKENELTGILMLRRHFAKYFPGLPNFGN